MLHRSALLTNVLALIVCGTCLAQSATTTSRVKYVTKVAFTEGPAWKRADGSLFFSDVANNRIMRKPHQGEPEIFREPSGRANGLIFDHQGRLIACEGANTGGERRVTRTESDGKITVLTAHFNGQRYNSPNDLTIDREGRIYFTDPRYGDRSDMQIRDDEGNAVEGVYRIDGTGKVMQVLAHEVDRPNGIALSHDGRFLFVADNNNSSPDTNRKLWRFDLDDAGLVKPKSRKLLYDWGLDRGPDGMTIDRAGRLYVAAGRNYPIANTEAAGKHKAAIYVITQEGELIDTVPIPMDDITNCTFGGIDLKTLYITCGHKLWSVETKVGGL